MPNASLLSAPISEPVVDENRKTKKAWVFFFNQIVDGDIGTEWTPTVANLTGDYVLTGKYFKNSGFIDFWILIDPNTTSASTFGSTYFELPFDVTVASACDMVYGSTVAQGIVDPSTNRLFPPTWAATASPVTLTARVFTQ